MKKTWAGLLGLWLCLCNTAVHAHAGSTAYLQLVQAENHLDLRWDIALRDLEDVLPLDANQDAELTWGEVQSAQDQIAEYLRSHIRAEVNDQPCNDQPLALNQIVEHAREPYLHLQWRFDCPAGPLRFSYRAVFDQDAGHRGLWQLSGPKAEPQAGIFTPEHSQIVLGAPTAAGTSLFASYFIEGLKHVGSGLDHVLFISGLFLSTGWLWTRQGWQRHGSLAAVLIQSSKFVTVFTVAHAITLALAATSVINLPSRWVEAAVAATVLFAGLNNLWVMVEHRKTLWLCAVFGLIHGSAIAGALLDLGLPAKGRVTALLGFNLGVESAQLLLMAVLVPGCFALRRWAGYPAWFMRPASLAIALFGLVWLLDRAFALDLPLPI